MLCLVLSEFVLAWFASFAKIINIETSRMNRNAFDLPLHALCVVEMKFVHFLPGGRLGQGMRSWFFLMLFTSL